MGRGGGGPPVNETRTSFTELILRPVCLLNRPTRRRRRPLGVLGVRGSLGFLGSVLPPFWIHRLNPVTREGPPHLSIPIVVSEKFKVSKDSTFFVLIRFTETCKTLHFVKPSIYWRLFEFFVSVRKIENVRQVSEVQY